MSDIQTNSLPSPTGGWNRRDALGTMDPSDAVVMDNFISTGGYVKVRGGYKTAVDTFPAGTGGLPVETLATYISGDKKELIFSQKLGPQADAQSDIFVVSNDFSSFRSIRPLPPDPDEPLIGYGLWTSMWKTLQFQGKLFFVGREGLDEPLVYDGVRCKKHTFTIDITEDELSFKSIIGITAYKRRIFMIEEDSLNLWYTDEAGTIGGKISCLNLADSAKKGGSFIDISEWTRTGANDMTSMLVATTTEGEVLMFSGIDPSTMDDWKLEGTYQIPAPVGYRCTTKMMDELVFATKGGYYTTSSIIKTNEIDKESSLSDKIRGAVRGLKTFYNNIGWQVIFLQTENLLMINVPISNTQTEQFVLNLENQTWSRFTGLNAVIFTTFGDEVFFGGKLGNIYQMYSGGNDNGRPINAASQQAFTTFEDPKKKHLRNVHILIGSAFARDIDISIAADFNIQPGSCIISTSGAPEKSKFSEWNDAYWNEAYWGSGTKADTLAIQEIGTSVECNLARYFSIGIRVKPFAEEENDFIWHSTTFNYVSAEE
jgi:hypothetical protein